VLTFFGLTSKDRAYIFNSLHEIAFNSQGAYSFEFLYNMPCRIRGWVFNKLKQYYEKEEKSVEDQLKGIPKQNKGSSTFKPKNFNPKYK